VRPLAHSEAGVFVSDDVKIRILSIYDAKGSQEAQKALDALAKANSKAAGGSGSSAAKPLKDTAAAAQQAQTKILALASAQARLQSAQGDAAGAAQTLSAALAKVDQSSIAGIRSQTQLAQVQNKLSGQSQSLTSLFQGQSSAIAGLGQQMGSLGGAVGGLAGSFGALAGSLGELGAVGAAIGIAKVGVDMAVVGGNAIAARESFESLSTSAHTTSESLLAGMRAAAQGTISDASLITSANAGILLTSGKLANELPKLIEISRAAAKASGDDVDHIFSSLVRGIARGSPLLIDNALLTIDASAAMETYAKSIGKSADSLTRAEQQTATLNAVMEKGNEVIKTTGGSAATTATQIAQGQAAFSNLKTAVSELAAIKLGPLATDIGAVTNAIAGAGDLGSAIGGELDIAGRFNPIVNIVQTLTQAVDQAGAKIAAFAGIEIPDNFSPLRNSIQQWLELLGLAPAAATTAATAAATMAGAFDEDRQAIGAAQEQQVAFTATGPPAAAMQGQTAAAAAMATAAFQAQQAETNALAAVTMTSVQAGMADAAAKQEVAAKTQLLTAETNAAVSAFMNLYPNISASGVAAMAAAGQITPLLAQLIAARLRANEATSAMIAFNNAAGIKAAQAKINADRAAGTTGRGSSSDAGEMKAANDRIAADKRAAQNAQTLAIGTSQQKQALLKSDYDAAVKYYGADSAQAINAQTKLLQAQEKGSTARAGAAGAAGAKLEGIESKTGDKLSQIVQDTQAKLIAIDQKAADERAKIAADLANKIATSAADRRAANEADDLDLIGVTDEKAAQKLNDREKAQAAAREREVAAAKEAQDAIANGEAESASKVYDVREKQISDQQALDEKYAERQRELAGNDEALAALKTQYDEATRANDEAAQTRIAIAKAEAEQKKAEVQAEKDAVIAAANEQANQVVSAAERSAAGVTKATAAAKTAAVANLHAIGDAVTAIPAQKTITITVNQQGTVGAESATGGGGSGTPKAAGGGTFVTTGKTNLVVGDNPGGRELVTVTPLSGKGQTRMGGGLIAMAGGGQVVVDAGGGYTTPIAGGTPAASSGGGGGTAGGKKPAAVDPKKALDEMKNTIQLLMDMAKLKEQIAALAAAPAFDIPVVQALVNRAQEFTSYVAAHLIPITKAEGESLARYHSAASDAASMIGDMADLKEKIAGLKDVPAFDQPIVLALIDRALQFTAALQQRLIPLTEFEATQFSRYRSAVEDAVSILKDVADLKKELAAAATVSLRDATIIRLADDAARIESIVSQRLVPMSKAQAEGIGTYADAVGSSVSLIKDVASLTAEMFDGYTSPSDAQLGKLAIDARRVASAFTAAGMRMTKEGAEAGKLYAEGLQATFGAAKDGLLVIDALKSGDFVLPQGALRQFESSSLDILATMSALGARAAAIPTSDIAALQSVTSAISGQAEALIKLAAVPFGDLSNAAGGLSQSGGAIGSAGGTIITNYNTFNLPPGSNQQTANEVIRILNQQVGARRG
jgi:hypothetical protein